MATVISPPLNCRSSVVDDLQPVLTPNEAAFYWYALRHSIARNGSPHVRLSGKALRRGLVKSSYSTAIENTISEGKVREIFRALESIGAIRKEGEANRDGRPYRVLVPDEIEACRNSRAARTAIESKPQVSVSEGKIDYYNVRENRTKVYERDDYKCRYCVKQLTRFTATLDHVKPVSSGGDNSFDNLITACLNCNSRKHHRPVGDCLAEG
jgi:5-methylcytosine-specific restriction endonuclease McrA